MTDEITPQAQQAQPKKDEKKPPGGGGKGPKRGGSASRTASISGGGGPRPSSRSSSRSVSKKAPTSAPTTAESGSDSTKKGARSNGHRKGSQSTSQGARQPNNSREGASIKQKQSSGSPVPPSGTDNSDALSSLQRVIADLKTTSPPSQPSNLGANTVSSVPMPTSSTGSSLPVNAPVFQPGAASFPGISGSHRKAASLGASSLPGGMNSYSPILETSQFHHGYGPPINEEDTGFQFPQQQMPPGFGLDTLDLVHRKPDGGAEISGIMAEQIAIQNQIEALQQQQQALYQQQLASNQVLSFQTPGLAPGRGTTHRRVHSTVPMSVGLGGFGGPQTAMGQFGTLGGLGMGLDGQAQGIPRGHGRRHSVNVLNKPSGQPSLGFSASQDGFEDGFAPPVSLGGAPQHNRSDSSWRINLAQAQAQLQSLQQFRAAAGGHHQKMASFSFPNMLPNMMAANMMGLGLGGINLLQQQQQQFQSQLQQQSSQPQRKSLFAPYLLRLPCHRFLLLENLLALPGKNDKKKDDVEVEGQGLMLLRMRRLLMMSSPSCWTRRCCRRTDAWAALFWDFGFVATSSAATKEKQEAERREREGDRGDEPRRPIERPKIVWFKPTDKRVPLIAIPTEQAPPDFVQNSEVYANKLFVACIKRHVRSPILMHFNTLITLFQPISSLHPFGTLVEELGPIGDIEVETSALLKDCNFPTEDFSENVMKCLPPIPWTIPERELDVRKDLRKERIFTIDPEDAKDLDDAVSIKLNDDATYDVGVHIADVSYFVKPNTALDRDARKRATSVYLVQRSDRLAFSVIFTMTNDAKIVKKWFGRTIIRSAAKLSYNDAQAVIDGKTLGSAVDPEHNAADIAHDIKFMLLTNIAVAQQVAVHFSEQAMLRRHDTPIERRLNTFVERAERLGYKMDTSSSGALMKSLESVEDPTARTILELLLHKTSPRAKYFCAGMLDIAKYGHYALNLPLYSHFTSPIRRYADILVHRQLDSILQGGPEPKFTMDRDAVAKVAQQCNIKRDSAKLAQEQSTHLFLCILISDLTHRYGPVVRQAKVVGVLDAAFDVLVPEFAIEKRVHVDQMPIDNHVYDEHSHTLQIYWSNRDVISWLAENSDDEHLKKVKQTAEQHAVKMEVASRSVHDEKALFDEDDTEEDEIVLGRSNDRERRPRPLNRGCLQGQSHAGIRGLKTLSAGHKIQEIRELMTVPVIVTADLTKSPPVIKVYSVNPYAEQK
ncbi:DIS3-like exonuclease 2 [Grifola frondosa]|uniref:DIS3-like exonuclease 2 n=1 Tax=Grifola frondosa TaxID=5627 RepID=A0A1C7M0E0_GRIFR|nr:DIS3-like exonuclease 2 [Grifola frondosa]